MGHLPAVVFNSRLDVLAVNDLGRALYGEMLDIDGQVNSARFMFLDEQAARRLFPEWERIADDTVSIVRVEAGRRPDDPAPAGPPPTSRRTGTRSSKEGDLRCP